ncbi:type IV pilus assembly PilZ (plasmid) [Gemmatirosa kalamazoonensis]|uniref:Type IV pilus assembly PilZ n=1 Tax=Gemmatirosa kalamazoonensis TaxID=861299 RepID=W0RU51_9BACT|nr:PilZ domain-containing protein [Gemmatirosa kalamazoonensis]AHG93840.1 type IV pilus assembly PilZ [Gemmatirosa kalamazoonensis]
MPVPNRRESYRVAYPLRASPTFAWNGVTARVIDCSEHGFCAQLDPHRTLPAIGSEIAGRIVFLDGSSVDVHGVVRHEREHVIGVQLENPGVPYRVLLWEQVRLRALESGWVEVGD